MTAALHWKVKLLLPPSMWKALPVSIDGQSYRQLLRRTTAFARKLSAMGIPLSISDENYLMSLRAGMDPMEFRSAALPAFFSGDAERIAALVARINSGA